MKNEGLYIRLLQGGKIKRHLVTILGEVPLEDTTIAEELITLSEQNHIPMYQAIKNIWTGAEWVERCPMALEKFERLLSSYLHYLRNASLLRYSLFMTVFEDQDEIPDHRSRPGASGCEPANRFHGA